MVCSEITEIADGLTECEIITKEKKVLCGIRRNSDTATVGIK